MTRKTWRTWTRREIDRLENMRLNGMTAQAIADELGRSLHSIRNRLCREDVKKPLSDRWLAVLAIPRPIRETARIMGTTIQGVKQAARRLRRAGFDVPKVRKRRA